MGNGRAYRIAGRGTGRHDVTQSAVHRLDDAPRTLLAFVGDNFACRQRAAAANGLTV